MDGKIWVVVRVQGEWSDRHETCLCWFPSETAAQAFVERATMESRSAAAQWRAVEDRYPEGTPDGEYEKFRDVLAILDSGFDPSSYDADGVMYVLRPVVRGVL